MGLFNFGKRNEESTKCDCGKEREASDIEVKQMASDEPENKKIRELSVKVLGSGCAKCNQLEAAVKSALVQLKINTEVEHVTDFAEIAAYGVMTTPALVVDEKVVSTGRILKTEEAVKILKTVLN
ncbi:MAG: thioredoxin family protein [Oscillospiraceae bacterium]